jgi:predicted aminopeptidase
LRLIRLIPLLLLAGLSLATAGCSPFYLLRAGAEQARILARRTPIQEIVRDPATPAEVRSKLELVLQARTYAERILDLDVGKSYTTYSQVDRDTLLLLVSAAHRDRFRAVTWWFPIIGHVPYKGYFDFDAAHRTAAELERRGFDTHVRPAAAFSTLGWFNDPLLSTLLRYGDVALASTVIHELTHNSLFLPSQVAFNESFASFVGDRGAIDFFCGIDGPDGRRCVEARDQWADNLVYGAFLSGLVAELEALYARTELGREEILARREDVFQDARRRFRADVQPRLRTPSYRGFAERPLNNATLIGRRLYFDRLHVFESAYERHGRDLPATVRAIIAAARAHPDAPYDDVDRLIP